jgi:hypothetical protein
MVGHALSLPRFVPPYLRDLETYGWRTSWDARDDMQHSAAIRAMAQDKTARKNHVDMSSVPSSELVALGATSSELRA